MPILLSYRLFINVWRVLLSLFGEFAYLCLQTFAYAFWRTWLLTYIFTIVGFYLLSLLQKDLLYFLLQGDLQTHLLRVHLQTHLFQLNLQIICDLNGVVMRRHILLHVTTIEQIAGVNQVGRNVVCSGGCHLYSAMGPHPVGYAQSNALPAIQMIDVLFAFVPH